jgi:hypothetical protein
MSRSTRERWHEAVKVALVGTARQERPNLLSEAAELAVAVRAGDLPAGRVEPPVSAPPEALARATAAQTRELEILLIGEPALLPEWLALCAAAGRRADERLLPELLERGRLDRDLRPALLAVLGARGRWLAAREPAWRWAVPADPSWWETGDRAQQLTFLVELRARDSGAGRALVERRFAEAGPEERAELVAALKVGLADADEPFLEAALDDRRKEVRLAAARLLYVLPRSRLAGRMAERARPLVPPDELDAAALRDGIEPTPPRGEGARAFWLRQIVSAAPLQGSPAAALARVARSEWRDTLILAWALAAARQRDPVWAEALLGVTFQVPELVALVEPARREELLVAVLARGLDDLSWHLLRHTAAPWGERLVAAAVRVARARPVAVEIARRAAPSAIGQLLSHPSMGATLPILERRAALHRAFQEPT